LAIPAYANFEKRTAADAREKGLDAHCQERSGAGNFEKLDITIEDLLVSCKMPQRDQKSYRLTKADWDEALFYSKREQMTPAMLIGLAGRTLMVFDFEDSLQLLLDRKTLTEENTRLKKQLLKRESKK